MHPAVITPPSHYWLPPGRHAYRYNTPPMYASHFCLSRFIACSNFKQQPLLKATASAQVPLGQFNVDFFDAVKGGEAKVVKAMLAAGFDKDAKDQVGGKAGECWWVWMTINLIGLKRCITRAMGGHGGAYIISIVTMMSTTIDSL